MPKGSKTIRIVTNDEALFASVRGAVSALDNWKMGEPQSVEDLIANPPNKDDVILMDSWLRSENVYESCRRLARTVRTRIYIVTDEESELAPAIATFCGATGTLVRPLSAERLRELEESIVGPPPTLPADGRGSGMDHILPERLLNDLAGEGSSRLIDVLVDPETGLYSYDYLNFKLDEEFKRSKRFELPLSCVMLGFEGQADDEVLSKLAGIFLNASRDTDVLGRFDQSSFLFFLPNTGPDGAETMARRIREQTQNQGLHDLVGDLLTISVGISYYPHVEVGQRSELFTRAREAFLAALHEGGVVRSS